MNALGTLLLAISFGSLPSLATGFVLCPTTTNNMLYRSHCVVAHSTISSTDEHNAAEYSSSADKPTQEWNVNLYQKQHNFVWKYGSSLIDLVRLSPGDRILDIGCGTGELTQALYQAAQTGGASKLEDTTTATTTTAATRNTVVMGMDADPRMIQKAQEQFPHLRFFVGDVRNFELLDHNDDDTNNHPESQQQEQEVDVIFSNAALHWVPRADVPRAVRAMSRALRPGGQFVVEFGGKGNVDTIMQATMDVVGWPADKFPKYFPSISEYTALLEQEGGMEVQSAALFDRPTELEGQDGVGDWLRMFGNVFFEGMSDAEREQVIDRVREMVRPKLYDETKQRWMADYRRIRIVARKL